MSEIEKEVSDIQEKNRSVKKKLIVNEDDKEKCKAEKRIMERYAEVYKQLQNCTDIDEFTKLRREFAELDVKVARITNKDTYLKSRCEMENRYSVL